jgi:hypothetical protein
MIRQCGTIVFLVLAVATMRGCGPKPVDRVIPLPLGDAVTIDRLAAGLGTLEPRPFDQPPARLMPDTTVTGTFRSTDRGRETRVPFSLSPHGDGWVLTVEGLQATYLAINDRGDLVMPREDDFTENARVDYDPALVVVPAGQTRYEGESRMTVRSLDGEQQRDRGTVEYLVETLGEHRLATPDGEHAAVIVRMSRLLRLSLAQVEVIGVDAYGEQAGPLAEHSERTVRALGGLYTDRSVSSLERVE